MATTRPGPTVEGRDGEWEGQSQDQGNPLGPGFGGHCDLTLDSRSPWANIWKAHVPSASSAQSDSWGQGPVAET